MGDCEKCTSVPCTENHQKKLYVGFGSQHLYAKVLEIVKHLNNSQYLLRRFDRYFIIEGMTISDLVKAIEKDNELSSIELRDVYVLPLEEHVDLSFDVFLQSRSLFYWMTLENNKDIVDCIEKGNIQTVFQPIIESKTLKVYGHEALVRAFNAEGEPISLGRLFSVSKQLGMLYNLDRQCRISSIESASRLGLSEGKLFINFIPTVIYDPNVCLRTTHAALEETMIKPEQVVFEVVESEHIEDYDHLKDILEHYRQKGYQTALDDIGTGYATLSNFNRLKTNYIKVDMEVIRDIHLKRENQVYLNEILAMKKEHEIMVIAEGVESQEEYDYIKSTDVDLVQGFFFAKPSNQLREGVVFCQA